MGDVDSLSTRVREFDAGRKDLAVRGGSDNSVNICSGKDNKVGTLGVWGQESLRLFNSSRLFIIR